jgi:hypothetical protein
MIREAIDDVDDRGIYTDNSLEQLRPKKKLMHALHPSDDEKQERATKWQREPLLY